MVEPVENLETGTPDTVLPDAANGAIAKEWDFQFKEKESESDPPANKEERMKQRRKLTTIAKAALHQFSDFPEPITSILGK